MSAPLARLHALADPGSVQSVGDDGVGVLTARLQVNGTAAIAFATDPAVLGGALGEQGCARIVEAIGAARSDGVPLVGLWHSGGARLGDGADALEGAGSVLAALARTRDSCLPQIAVVLGPCAGGAGYAAAMADVVVMGPAGRLFVNGPAVVRSMTGEDVSTEQLGGPTLHGVDSGVAHLVASSDDDALAQTRGLIGLLARHGRIDPAAVGPNATLRELARAEPVDVRAVVAQLVDDPVELHPRWAPSALTLLGRLGGRTVGVLANDPRRLGGFLDTAATEKATGFTAMCDALGIALVVLEDVRGFRPGRAQERAGALRHGAALMRVFAGATVPRVTLLLGRAHGGAYLAMNSYSLGASAVFAWPGADVAVMDAEPAVEILHHRELAAADPADRAALRERLVTAQASSVRGVERAVQLGAVDAVIDPADSVRRIAETVSTFCDGQV